MCKWDKILYSQFLNPVGHDHDVTMITSCHRPVATATAIVLPVQLSRPPVLHSCCHSCCCCAVAAVVHVPQPQLLCSCCRCCYCSTTTVTQSPLLQLLWSCRCSCCCQPLLPSCCTCNTTADAIVQFLLSHRSHPHPHTNYSKCE